CISSFQNLPLLRWPVWAVCPSCCSAAANNAARRSAGVALRRNVVRRTNNQYTPSYERIISDCWIDNDERRGLRSRKRKLEHDFLYCNDRRNQHYAGFSALWRWRDWYRADWPSSACWCVLF